MREEKKEMSSMITMNNFVKGFPSLTRSNDFSRLTEKPKQKQRITLHQFPGLTNQPNYKSMLAKANISSVEQLYKSYKKNPKELEHRLTHVGYSTKEVSMAMNYLVSRNKK